VLGLEQEDSHGLAPHGIVDAVEAAADADGDRVGDEADDVVVKLVAGRHVVEVGDPSVVERAREAARIRDDDVVDGAGRFRREIRRDRVGRRDDDVRRGLASDGDRGAGLDLLSGERDGGAGRRPDADRP
jgi:hypothetical protein